MNDVDLSLVSGEDLIKELGKRFDVFIFSGMQLRGGPNEDILTIRKWMGNKATCAGLASQIQIALYDTYQEELSSEEESEKKFEF